MRFLTIVGRGRSAATWSLTVIALNAEDQCIWIKTKSCSRRPKNAYELSCSTDRDYLPAFPSSSSSPNAQTPFTRACLSFSIQVGLQHHQEKVLDSDTTGRCKPVVRHVPSRPQSKLGPLPRVLLCAKSPALWSLTTRIILLSPRALYITFVRLLYHPLVHTHIPTTQ